MTNTDSAPIATRTASNGRVLAIGPEARIRPALNGAQPLTIEKGPIAGDTVRLGSGYQDGAQGWGQYAIAYTIEHPAHGTIIAAYIDEAADATADAPQLRAIRGRQLRDASAADERAAAEERRIISEGGH